MKFVACSNFCKLAVLPGARVHKLALHYSRAAEPSGPGPRFPGLRVYAVPCSSNSASRVHTECRPSALQGLGARSACGRR